MLSVSINYNSTKENKRKVQSNSDLKERRVR